MHMKYRCDASKASCLSFNKFVCICVDLLFYFLKYGVSSALEFESEHLGSNYIFYNNLISRGPVSCWCLFTQQTRGTALLVSATPQFLLPGPWLISNLAPPRPLLNAHAPGLRSANI